MLGNLRFINAEITAAEHFITRL